MSKEFPCGDLAKADCAAPMFFKVLRVLETAEDLVGEGEAITEDGVIFEGCEVDHKAAGGKQGSDGDLLGKEAALDREADGVVEGELICADKADTVGGPVEGEASGDKVLSCGGPDDDIVAVDASGAQAADDGGDGGGLDARKGGSSGIDQDPDFVTRAEPCTPSGLAVGLSCDLHDELGHHVANECGVGCGLIGAKYAAATDIDDVPSSVMPLSTDHLADVDDGREGGDLSGRDRCPDQRKSQRQAKKKSKQNKAFGCLGKRRGGGDHKNLLCGGGGGVS